MQLTTLPAGSNSITGGDGLDLKAPPSAPVTGFAPPTPSGDVRPPVLKAARHDENMVLRVDAGAADLTGHPTIGQWLGPLRIDAHQRRIERSCCDFDAPEAGEDCQRQGQCSSMDTAFEIHCFLRMLSSLRCVSRHHHANTAPCGYPTRSMRSEFDAAAFARIARPDMAIQLAGVLVPPTCHPLPGHEWKMLLRAPAMSSRKPRTG